MLSPGRWAASELRGAKFSSAAAGRRSGASDSVRGQKRRRSGKGQRVKGCVEQGTLVWMSSYFPLTMATFRRRVSRPWAPAVTSCDRSCDTSAPPAAGLSSCLHSCQSYQLCKHGRPDEIRVQAPLLPPAF